MFKHITSIISISLLICIFSITNARADLPVIHRNASKISAGYNHSAAVTTDGKVWTWGYNNQGQLGIGNAETFSYTPAQVEIDDVIDIATSMSSTNSHSLALKSDGTVWAWGNNDNGQLGTVDCCATRYTPVQVYNLSDIVAIDAGNKHSMALALDGTVWVWGSNESGQIGNGTNTGNAQVPYQVTNLSDVEFIAAGGNHCLVLKSDGTVWGWGDNSRGQLGDNTITNHYAPIQVKGHSNVGYLDDIIAIAAGTTHSLALKNDGTVWVWGENSTGQGGQGSTATDYYETPIQVKGQNGISYLTNISSISAGESHNIALSYNGNVFAWGSNGAGQLGDFSNSSFYYPVITYQLTDVRSIDSGNFHNLVIKSDGSVWSWGQNTNGVLGDNSTNDSNIPIRVLGSQNGFLELGKYLPQTITMMEDTITYVRFSLFDKEGANLILSTDSDGFPPIEIFSFISDQTSGTSISVTLAANESIDITLQMIPAKNQYGTDAVKIIVSGDAEGAITETSSISILNSADAPIIGLDNQWTPMDNAKLGSE